jgi:UDP-glucuronate decarboxylase
MKYSSIDLINDSQKIIENVNLSDFSGKSILITGASGLVGQYLIATLINAEKVGIVTSRISVLCMSNPSENFKDLLSYSNKIDLHSGDLTDINFINSLPKSDFIIHAAGYGQPGKFMINQIKTIELNTTCTIRLFEKLAPNGRFLFLSTSEVYSGLNNPPFNESQIGTTNTNHFRSCYIEGKRCGEAIVNAYRDIGISAFSARLALAYGPGTKKDDVRVMNDFIRKALVDGNIELKDSGDSMRTYIYITDAVEIMFNIILNGTKAIYNIGGQSRTTIYELAKNIGLKTSTQVTRLENNKSQKINGAPDDVFLDMKLVESEFGKCTFVDLDKGLDNTINWQKHLFENH